MPFPFADHPYEDERPDTDDTPDPRPAMQRWVDAIRAFDEVMESIYLRQVLGRQGQARE